MTRVPLPNMRLLMSDVMVWPSLRQANLGFGAASGLQTIVTFPSTAAYVSDSSGRFLNVGLTAE